MHATKLKKPILRVYILYDSNYITSWKMQNSGDSKRISGCTRLGGKEVYIGGSTEDFVGQ